MAAKNPSFTTLHLHFSLAIASLFFTSHVYSVSAHNHHNHQHEKLGFTVDLIHRDSPKSPFYNPSESPSDRLQKALIRSRSRLSLGAEKISPNAPPTQSTLLSNRGEYLMEIALGTPRKRLLAIADTGSDITWTQCAPCRHCYKQAAPLFDPAASRTYKAVPCSASLCESIAGGSPCFEATNAGEPCQYEVLYGDRSYTRGTIATETLELASAAPGRPVAFPGFVFGCGHDNDGTFDAKGTGIVGLANGAGSLVTQLGDSIDHKFSYCLVPLMSNSSSKINFGSTAVVSGPGTITAPLLQDMDPEIFYYVGVKSISVGNKTFTVDYDTIIDSGTTLTLIPQTVYDQLESALVKAITLEHVMDPFGVLSLCFQSTTAEPGSNFPVPPITINFGGGADVKWGSLNTFVRVADDVVCFAFIGVPSGNVAIIGNLAQMNFLVGYDLQKNTVSFKPTDCTKKQSL